MLYVPASAVPPDRFPALGPARLVRTADLDEIEDGASMARMYVSSRGGALRTLLGSAHRHVISMRRDPQMAHGQPAEGTVEGPAMMRCATDPDITFYLMQPFRLVLPVNGRLVSWIADIIYVDTDGTVWVREIKRRVADLAEPEYEAKLEAVNWLVSRLGWRFKPWTRAEIVGSPGRELNVATIYFDRAASLDGLMPRFEEILAGGADTTYGDLARDLDPINTCRARAAVHRLIMQGRVWADLDRLLEDWSPVRLRRARAMTRSPLE